MAQVTASLVKELRDRTGLGMMECKRALKESGADIDKAIEELRKSSGMKAAKKAGRTAADGLVAVKTENGYGMVLEVNSETDFAARDEGFKGFVATVLDTAFAQSKLMFLHSWRVSSVQLVKLWYRKLVKISHRVAPQVLKQPLLVVMFTATTVLRLWLV